MSYYLESNMSDRLNFDRDCFDQGHDSASTMSVDDARKILANPADIKDVASSAWDLTEYQAEAEDEPYFVEDIEEAEARFLDSWARGFRAGLQAHLV